MSRQYARRDFESFVDRSGGPESCHPWTGSRDGKGYGLVKFQGVTRRAHRVAFFLEHGRWPEPCALHRCDNPPCVNARHLFEGTSAENNADRDAKGRQARGDRNGLRLHPERHLSRLHPELVARGEGSGTAKLTDQVVRDIRANYLLCRVTQRELAARFGVTQGTVSRVVRDKAWQHL